MHLLLQVIAILFCSQIYVTLSLKAEECEVCFKVLDKFRETVKTSDEKEIETEFKKFCEASKGKDRSFCYYVGGVEEAATKTVGEVTRPLSFGMPTDKICEKLKKKDRQICDLRYKKQIDVTKVDLKKLKVKDLKQILNDWDESCIDCLEKSDFIKRIEELKPKHVKQEL